MSDSEHLLTHQEVVEAVIIHQNIHEGFWRLNINFNVAATHGKNVPDPCVAVTIRGIGILPTDATDEMAVDAALVNPEIIIPPPEATQFCRDVYRNVAVHLDDASKPASATNAVDLRDAMQARTTRPK